MSQAPSVGTGRDSANEREDKGEEGEDNDGTHCERVSVQGGLGQRAEVQERETVEAEGKFLTQFGRHFIAQHLARSTVFTMPLFDLLACLSFPLEHYLMARYHRSCHCNDSSLEWVSLFLLPCVAHPLSEGRNIEIAAQTQTRNCSFKTSRPKMTLLSPIPVITDGRTIVQDRT